MVELLLIKGRHMKTKFKSMAYSLLFALVLSLVGYMPAMAQGNGTAIKVSPVLFDELTAAPGEQLSGQVTLSNPGDTETVLYPTSQNFLPDTESEEGIPSLTENDTPYGMKDWISFDQNSVSLAPGASDTIKFFINVPANANPGGRYGSMLFSTKAPEGTPETTSLKVESAVNTLVLLKVSGNVTEAGNVVEFSTKGLDDQGKVDFSLRFANTGNIHFKPKGMITITNWLGSTVAEVELEGENVLPDSIRNMVTTWEPQGTLFGKYTATVNGTFGSSNTQFTEQTSFSKYHFTTLLIILVIIILIILFIKMSSKSYKEELSKEIKEEMKR